MTATSRQPRREPTRQPSADHRAWRLVGGTVRFVGRVLRGLIAAAVLLTLVVALPWALSHYIGWPLPHHIPTWVEVQGVLLGPMTTTFLLDFLACACWIAWAAFTLDVARCSVDVARGARLPDISAAGPVHTLAAVLIGAVLLSILGNRPTSPPTGSLSAAIGTGSGVVATAPAWQHSPHATEATVRHAVFATQMVGDGSATVSAPAHPESVVVRAPENGVHDSLWRIAARSLGDGARWPEIFDLNKGKPQPGGRTFITPSLVYPGQELALPADAAPPPPAPTTPQPPSPPAHTSTPPLSPPPASTQPSTPASPTQQAPPTVTGTNSAPSAPREPGVSWGPELFVGLGLAASVSAALLVARRRYRRGYRPGSGDRDDLPVAPVVYQLRLAHLRAEHDDEIDLDEDYDDGERPERVASPAALMVGTPETGSGESFALAPGLGVRDGREIALNLAVARGLGLVGAGGAAATRALLITALTTPADHLAATSPPVRTSVIIPTDDLVALLGRGATRARLPAALRVVESLDDALDALEAETLVRLGGSHEPGAEPRCWPAVVLVTRPPEHQRQRLQAVLDNGSAFGITGLLLGQWQPGVTVYVREDGTISASSPGLGEALRGGRMFHLGDDDTADLLTLLHQAQPEPPTHDEVPAPPPMPRPRVVPAEPAQGGPVTGEPEPTWRNSVQVRDVVALSDTELEVTAAVADDAPVLPDTELEILGPRAVPAPGARLRPGPAVRETGIAVSATISAPEDAMPVAAEDDDSEVSVASAAMAEARAAGTTAADAVPIRIAVLGPPQVFWRPEPDAGQAPGHEVEITGAFQPRTRELLVFLALHPGGASREALVAALWSDSPPEKTTNSMNTALSRLRRSLGKATGGALSDIAVVGEGRCRLDPAVVDVDYWHFDTAVTARRAAATDGQRVDAYRAVVDSYGGALADGMSTEWVETAREAIRRDAIDTVASLARALVADDPQQTLDLLEMARAFDPHNEALYRDIMRLQERLGQLDAIPRTLTLLTTRLAEVADRPTEHAIGLASRLRQRHDDTPAAQATSATRGERGRSAAI